jgi:UDP-N-acetylglucosamine--N-acetylmuramyl-(pentapeptide) pyrophosphoryl-undecaprenol N-acetylglucosamine transferase
MSVCIALATGGTAGHVTPALAMAEAVRRRWPGARVLLLGSTRGFEARLVAAQGHAFTPLPAAPWHGAGPVARLRAVERLAVGTRAARRALAEAGADVVLGFGGYASAGAVLGARSLGLGVVLHEANARPGLSNRLLGRVASRICVAWPAAAAAFPGAARVAYTGMPIRADLAALAAGDRSPPRSGHLRLVVCGGSLGSPFLNRRMPALAKALCEAGVGVEVWHQAGPHPLDDVRAAYAAVRVAARVQAHVDDMAAAYRWADLAVACAGAATLAELAAAGLPAVLVPFGTASDDHQADNAAAFARATGATWLRENEWHPAALAAALAPLARDASLWTAHACRVRALARPEAADAVASVCAELIAERRAMTCGT